MLGVWYALLDDMLGNWAGQQHDPSYVPIIYCIIAVLIFVHGAMIASLARS